MVAWFTMWHDFFIRDSRHFQKWSHDDAPQQEAIWMQGGGVWQELLWLAITAAPPGESPPTQPRDGRGGRCCGCWHLNGDVILPVWHATTPLTADNLPPGRWLAEVSRIPAASQPHQSRGRRTPQTSLRTARVRILHHRQAFEQLEYVYYTPDMPLNN